MPVIKLSRVCRRCPQSGQIYKAVAGMMKDVCQETTEYREKSACKRDLRLYLP